MNCNLLLGIICFETELMLLGNVEQDKPPIVKKGKEKAQGVVGRQVEAVVLIWL